MSQNLSHFHAELLDYLSRDVAMRIATDGFDEAADPELKAFRHSLTSALTLGMREPLALTQIVERYQYLFASRGPLHLEKKLLETFSSKEGKWGHLSIYRGLPRLYRKERPSDSRIKEGFNHLPTLKRLIAEKAIFQLYEAIEHTENSKVSLFTWVINDGWGDYIAAFETLEILMRRFADLQLSWVVLVPKRLGSPPMPKGTRTHLIYYDQQAPISLVNREALEILRTSDLVLQIPTFYPLFDALRDAVDAIEFSSPPPTWLSIGEYGYLESSWYHPQTANRSMGLHFLEKGVLIRAARRQAQPSFLELENLELLQSLFETTTPGPVEIEQYKATHHFYLAYLTSSIGGAVYLHSLVKAHEMDKLGIDICCPDIGWLIRYAQAQALAGRPFWEVEGVRLELYHQGKMIFLSGQTQGKPIRVFSASVISPTDFHTLIHLSGEWVAVRGDQSFSEVVSVNKGFFYDGRLHARYFIKDLLALAENRIGEHRSTLEVLRGCFKAFLHNTPISSEKWVEETDFQEREPWREIALKIGVALQDPDCLAGFKKLNRIIAEEHSCNAFFCNLIQRELCHRTHPEVAVAEEGAVLPFTKGAASLSETIESIDVILRAIKTP